MCYLKLDPRSQQQLLPAAVEDYVALDNPVRALDLFVENLNLPAEGFNVVANQTPRKGRPAIHPATLLKLYLWGYLNQTRSSRRLEKACTCNLEVIWLVQSVAPDHSTIAQFRKDNAKALKAVFKRFNLLCLQAGLFSTELIAIDGTFIKAVNSRDRSFTKAKLTKQLEAIEKIVDRWMEKLEATDQADAETDNTRETLHEKIEWMKKRATEYEALLVACEQSDTGQVSLTDRDSVQLKKGDKKTVGFNVQTAVESKNHLIISCEVTQDGNDMQQLNSMAQQAKKDLLLPDDAPLTVLADKGYGTSTELAKCETNGTVACVPMQRKSVIPGNGSMPLEKFEFIVKEDAYLCPEGKLLHRKKDSCGASGVNYRVYYTGAACRGCKLLECCTKGTYRKLKINEHQAAIDANLKRIAENPSFYGKRRAVVEHPFGTIKSGGGGELLCRGLDLASAEMALSSWSYNFKRVFNLLGFAGLMKMV